MRKIFKEKKAKTGLIILAIVLGFTTCGCTQKSKVTNNTIEGATSAENLASANAVIKYYQPLAAKDPTRPIYHLTAPSQWINDPCGLFYADGSFHVFFQTNPWGSKWGSMSWSQVVSVPDQKGGFKWFYPIDSRTGALKTVAIVPSMNPHAYDRDGIFTGSVMMLPYYKQDKYGAWLPAAYHPTAFYSAVWGDENQTQEVICMARALDYSVVNPKTGTLKDPWITNWTKYSRSLEDPNNNPAVIIKQPTSTTLTSFRDPYLFTMGDGNTYMIISGGYNKKNKSMGAVLLYKHQGPLDDNGQLTHTDYTKNWTRVNTGNNFFYTAAVAIKDPISRRGDFETAAIFRLTDHNGTFSKNGPYILIYGQDASIAHHAYYVLGNIIKNSSGIHFVPLANFKNTDGTPWPKQLDLNPNFVYYSANTLHIDNEQRNLVLGWLNIGSQNNKNIDYHWHGMLGIPRRLFEYKDNTGHFRLGQEPALVNALRMNKASKHFVFKPKKGAVQTITLNGITGVHINIDAIFSGNTLRDSQFGISIAVRGPKKQVIRYDGKAGLLTVGNIHIHLNIPDVNNKKCELNIYLDGSSLEIFISKFRADGVAIPYKVFSGVLENNSDEDNLKKEQADVFGSAGVVANVTTYKMDSCWMQDGMF